MDKLIFKRKKKASQNERYGIIRLRNEAYDIILEIQEETGETKTEIADKLIKFAYKHIQWEE